MTTDGLKSETALLIETNLLVLRWMTRQYGMIGICCPHERNPVSSQQCLCWTAVLVGLELNNARVSPVRENISLFSKRKASLASLGQQYRLPGEDL